MLIGWIVAAVVAAALTLTLLTRRMARDDVHSVEGYHRSIHTLGTINAHPAVAIDATDSHPRADPADGSVTTHSARSASAVRVMGTPSVRVTDAPTSSVPSAGPLHVTHHDAPLIFQDEGASPPLLPPELSVTRDKAMGSINHRPRRLAAPAIAVGVVIVLVVVLLLTGSHDVAPPPHHRHGSSAKNTRSHVGTAGGTQATTTSTTPPPVVVPQSSTPHDATYTVTAGAGGAGAFTLALSATSGACWVDATNSASGATLFAGTLEPGQQHSLVVSPPVTVVIGAPTVLAVSLNGGAVALPNGFRTPFTMNFLPAR